MKSNSKPRLRNSLGSNVVEFTYCLVFIFFIILLPLSNYGTFLARWGTSQQIIQSWTQGLAKKKKLSDAFIRSQQTDFLEAINKPTGITVKKITPFLLVSRVDNPSQAIKITNAGKLPTQWQPDAGKFEYTFHLLVEAAIEPLVTVQLFGMNIPGLTAPAEVQMSGSSLWENMSRDPTTTEFYLNE